MRVTSDRARLRAESGCLLVNERPESCVASRGWLITIAFLLLSMSERELCNMQCRIVSMYVCILLLNEIAGQELIVQHGDEIRVCIVRTWFLSAHTDVHHILHTHHA